ncbi:hypothetical protein BDR06DRAFT_1005966 [Suillus hirtellus]|nr:hypothetical protein BDR06DRAFT_1005966 [Suillus hirtellus]
MSSNPISLDTSLANSPSMRMDHSLNNNKQEEEDDFIVPILNIEMPLEDPLMSASMDSVVIVYSNVPDSEPLTNSHVPYAPSDLSHDLDQSSIPEPLRTSPATPPSTHTSNDLSTSTNSTDLELTLSTSTFEQFDTSDCYSSVNDNNVINLYNVTDCHTESKPFITQANLYGPGAKTSHFDVNIDDGAMVNVLNLKAYHKVA